MVPEFNNPLAFASAYRQLRPAARVFVDRYMVEVEREANLSNRVMPVSIANFSARDQAMLSEPLVQAAIAERIRDVMDALTLSPRKVIKELSGIAFSNIAHYMTVHEDGQPSFDLTRCTPEQLASIKTIKVTERATQNGTGERKFEFVLHDKLAALQTLAKYMGLDQGDNPHWASEKARNVTPETQQVTASMNDETVGDLYARMIA